jgi:cell division inhibitor SepF
MKKNWLDKLLGAVGFEEEIVEEEEEPVTDVADRKSSEQKHRASKGKVVSLTTQQFRSMRVVVLEPSSFDEVQEIADHLREKRPVILNLEATEKSLAKRIVDFVSGAVYVLDGGMQRINTSIFLFTPAEVDIVLNAPGIETPASYYSRDFASDRDSHDTRDSGSTRDMRESRDTRDMRDSRETRDYREGWDGRNRRD